MQGIGIFYQSIRE